MIKLIIFDLDGTLIHSSPDIVRTVNALLAARGRAPLPEPTIVAAIGEGLKQLVFDLFPETHSDPAQLEQLEHDFLAFYERNLLVETKVFGGADEFLAAWPRQIALVTNKNIRMTKILFENLSLGQHRWAAVFGADSLPNRKPDPLPLLEAMRIAGVERHETVMIGDGIPDMIAARRAGVHSIAIEFGYTQLDILRAQGASLTLPSFADLPRLLTEIEALPPRKISPA